MRRTAVIALGALVAAASCGDDGYDGSGEPAAPALELEVVRQSAALTLRHREHGQEIFGFDVRISDGRLVLTARASAGLRGTLDMLASPPGAPVSGRLRAALDGEDEQLALEVRNGRAVLPGGARLSLSDAVERDHVRAALTDSPALPLLAALAPYRDAVLARFAEAAPLYAVIALYRTWPDGREPAWPRLVDPRDADPPGMLDGDRIGLGMTCSPQIRCPDAAPFCVSRDHDAPFGFCSRACSGDADCGGEPGARCSLTVVDVPDVVELVTMCQLDCPGGSCPALLTCGDDSGGVCWPPP